MVNHALHLLEIVVIGLAAISWPVAVIMLISNAGGNRSENREIYDRDEIDGCG